MVDELRQSLINGRRELPGAGMVRAGAAGSLPFVVVDESGVEIEPFSLFLRDLMLTDMSPLTARSYGFHAQFGRGQRFQCTTWSKGRRLGLVSGRSGPAGGYVLGWPGATIALCAPMTLLGWRRWRSGCCAPIPTAS